jgi:hypothetical protein
MGRDTKTYWLTDRQSQCDVDVDFDFDSIARQRNRKDAFLTKEYGAFCEVHAEVISWRQSDLRVSQLQVADSHGKFVAEVELEVGLWRFNVWF